MLNYRIVWHDKVTSTNDVCVKAAVEGELEGLVIAAYFQEHGRGQRGNSWESEVNKNLTFSLLLRPAFLKVEQQFMLSKIIALGVIDWLKSITLDATIKWPNDIYVIDCKIAGILIENGFSSNVLDYSVAGIGVNLNQTAFSSDIPNPTSVLLATGVKYVAELVIVDLLEFINVRYQQLIDGLTSVISDDYLNRLYRRNNYYQYIDKNEKFEARIVGVKPGGELMLETKGGTIKSYGFKEVSFVMKT